MQYVATCLFGLEKFLGDEIDALGLKRIDTMDGRVTFEGEPIDCARANLHLRTAERVLIRVGSFPATDFTMLFDGVKSLPWEEFIGAEDAFPVKGHSIRSALTSIPDCQSIIKKAVAMRLAEHYPYDRFPETGVKYQIEFFLFRDEVTMMIDTSGDPLHKRGYRPESGGAPLRETLAAAMVMNARITEDLLVWDPFCGSGTILIEAVMYVNRIAPGLDRSFAGEDFACLPPALWEKARAEAEEMIRYDSTFEAWGSDLDTEVLSIAKGNALRAGVRDQIKFFRADAREIYKPAERKGTILTNPPYGERLLTVEEAEALYREIGRNFRSFEPWQIYILTMSETFERSYGRRADKVRKLYNGMIPCNLYQYYLPAHVREERHGDRRSGTYHPFDKPKGGENRERRFDGKKDGGRPYGDRQKPFERRDSGDRPRYSREEGDRPRYPREGTDRPRYPREDGRERNRFSSEDKHRAFEKDRRNGAPYDPHRTQVWRDRTDREIPVRRMNPHKPSRDAETTEKKDD